MARLETGHVQIVATMCLRAIVLAGSVDVAGQEMKHTLGGELE